MEGTGETNNLAFIKDLAVAVQPLLIAAVIWFMKDRRKRDDDESKTQRARVEQLVIDMAIVKHEATGIKEAVSGFSGELKNFRAVSEDVAVLKRDLKSAWRHIEELRGN